MTRATLTALLAGLLAAAALAELGPALAARAARSGRRRGPAAERLLPLLARLGRRLGALSAPSDLAQRLAAAGRPLGLEPGDVMAVKAGAALVGALLATAPASTFGARHAALLVAAAAGGAFAAPDLWLRRRTRLRAEAMSREIADVLDLLRVAVDAGLPVTRALGEVGRRHSGLLAAELATTAAAIELGVPREGALAGLAQRVPLAAVGALTATIERSERHGSPLGPALAGLAEEARAEQRRAIGERAARAAPKMQLAVALLLVPAAMLVIAAGASEAVR